MFKKLFHFSTVYLLVLFFGISIGIAQQYPMIQITYNPLEQVEPWIAINPSNPSFLLVAWSDARWGGLTYEPLVGYSFSTNGGNNWTVDDTMAYPPEDWRRDFHIAEHVTVAFNRTGTVFCGYRIGYDNEYDIRNWGVVISKTNNFSSKDWTDIILDKIVCTSESSEVQRDFPFLAIDNTGIIGKDGNIYISWICRKYSSRPIPLLRDSIKFCRSIDSGATFSTPILIDRQIIGSDTLTRFPRIAIGPNGEVYLAWLRYKSLSNGEIRIKKSIDGGQSFSPGFVSIQVGAMIDIPIGRLDISSCPAISVDKNTGYIYLAWANYESGDINIRFSRSTDAGQTFSTPVIATEHTLNKQFFPALTVDPTGKVILTYYSNHSTQQYINLYMTESYDNGNSFTHPDIDITTSDNNNDPAVGLFDYYSYYHGTSADVGYNYPVWQYSTGSVKADIYNSRVNRTPTSNSGAATAFGSTQKTIFSTITNRWNTIYMSNGALYHMYSTDEGATWNDYTRISGTVGGIVTSSNPSLVEDGIGTLHCVFSSSGNGIYYTKKQVSGSWISPVKLYSGTKTSYPTLTVDNNGYGHVVFVSDQPGVPLSILYYLLYGKFNTTSPGLFENPITITGPTTTFTGTSLTQLNNGQLHAVWSRGNEIYYSYGTESGWSSPLNISNNSGISECPSIASIDYGTGYVLRVAWQDNTPGNYDIFCRH
ncbi:MAG: exo-alpha-sialidase, partial [Ignavibacteriales bacterium]|nr:exo-alpha-sialidase [Ignavibacteriales bacterium]